MHTILLFRKQLLHALEHALSNLRTPQKLHFGIRTYTTATQGKSLPPQLEGIPKKP
ncbi:hypothetical protein AXF42_Ash011250 [Apostasia shenzhenica]|uniref:Uncharacterized protein n=1 Tax=Apostasia shenzhenica TaxID=1088818 RepID=A0A2I0AL98_9ASPA|nr:hypothetical protein AXF42_Ash011250 [Apostasia shenzhenica]